MSVYLPEAYELSNHWTEMVLLYCEVLKKFMIVKFYSILGEVRVPPVSTLPEKLTIEKIFSQFLNTTMKSMHFLATFKLKLIQIKQF